MFKRVRSINVMYDLIMGNKGVWDICIDWNPIHVIGLNPFTIRVKVDYTKIGFESNFLT